MNSQPDQTKPARRRLSKTFILAVLGSTVVAVGAVALLVNIMERKQEARNPFYRVVELTEETVDPEIWGKNFPFQYDGYKRTVDMVRTRYGGSEAVPRTPLWPTPGRSSPVPNSRKTLASK